MTKKVHKYYVLIENTTSCVKYRSQFSIWLQSTVRFFWLYWTRTFKNFDFCLLWVENYRVGVPPGLRSLEILAHALWYVILRLIKYLTIFFFCISSYTLVSHDSLGYMARYWFLSRTLGRKIIQCRGWSHLLFLLFQFERRKISVQGYHILRHYFGGKFCFFERVLFLDQSRGLL